MTLDHPLTTATVQVPSPRSGEGEKMRVALSSVLAAILLTAMKLTVGILTGSLGILSEAAHSALDLVAAGMTYFAVRISGRPADQDHTYGHGKIENLSALFETVLLLVTCAWIVYEAIQRLFFKTVEVEATLWAFLVMVVSIVIDFGRSRALSRAARKYNSQALEADALHFSTDIWSSSVVIVGLALVRLSDVTGLHWLAKADAVAAVGVAGIVTYVSLRLGRRTVAALLDAVPATLGRDLSEAVRVPGVLEVKRARLRHSGPESFADVTLAVAVDTPLDRAHEIATRAEAAARQLVPGIDIVVHVEPSGNSENGLLSLVRSLAARHGLSAHAISAYEVAGKRSLELHLEMSEDLSLERAHAQASAFEQELHRALPKVERIVTHLEPVGEGSTEHSAAPADDLLVLKAIKAVTARPGLACRPHEVSVRRVGRELFVSFHCALPAETAIADAHLLTTEVERALRSLLPGLGRVVIHVEPIEAAT